MTTSNFESKRIHIKSLEAKGLEIVRSTVSAAEFIGDTLRAEGRHFSGLAYEFLTAKLTGHKFNSDRDISLEPLAGVGTSSASVGEDPNLR